MRDTVCPNLKLYLEILSILMAQKIAKLQSSKRGRESTGREPQNPNSEESCVKQGGKRKFTSKEYIEDSDDSENSSVEEPVNSA